MPGAFVVETAVLIDADVDAVWRALTDPAMIKEYLFGTEVETDWRAGSPITYRGVWNGTTYEDKGKILEVVPRSRLVSTYWSSMSGLADVPENYSTVAYSLQNRGGRTELKLTQDNNATQEAADHSRANWDMVLGGLKRLLEQGSASG